MELASKEEGFEQSELKNVIDRLQVYEYAKTCEDENTMSRMIVDHKLAREHVPTRLLNSKEVWRALIRFMPVHDSLD